MIGFDKLISVVRFPSLLYFAGGIFASDNLLICQLRAGKSERRKMLGLDLLSVEDGLVSLFNILLIHQNYIYFPFSRFDEVYSGVHFGISWL